MKTSANIFLSLGLLLMAVSCEKNKLPEGMTVESYKTNRYVNSFVRDYFDVYYLWRDELGDALEELTAYRDPYEALESLRYPDDHWTMLTDDYSGFVNSVKGLGLSYGLDFTLYYADEYKENLIMVVNYVYSDSPASDAGLKRGDKIIRINGSQIPYSDYSNFLSENYYNSSSCVIHLSDNTDHTIEARDMYCEPINVSRVFDCSGKKVAYLHYTDFTYDSADSLNTLFAGYKAEGVEEMILDMRYNGGGYVRSERALASLLAPREAVQNQDIFQTEVYNSALNEAWKDDLATRFSSLYLDSNISARKIYAIVTSNSASASEGVICGLLPYCDITIIGEKTHGKYTAGSVFSGELWYESYREHMSRTDYEEGLKYAGNWGLYIMLSRYADKNGETPNMPDGFTPDIEAHDNPLDPTPLGDPGEQMLKVALTAAGYAYPEPGPAPSRVIEPMERCVSCQRPAFGILLK